MSRTYPTDLRDTEWAILEPLLPPAKPRGRPRADLRQVLNAIRYVTRSGAQWRMIPRDLVPGVLLGRTSAVGARMAPGNESMTPCDRRSAARLSATHSLQQASWTASQSRRSNEVVTNAASMAAS